MNPVERLPTGIFGPSLSGKTTLARSLVCEYERHHGKRALILDPHREKWGEHSIVFSEEAKFWETVWASRNCVVVCEEAAATLRRDREFMPAFTRIRHNQHKMIVVGHSGTDLLPGMRQQIATVYLFRQPEEASDVWAKQFADKSLLEAQSLQQYEFIRKISYQPARKMKLKL